MLGTLSAIRNLEMKILKYTSLIVQVSKITDIKEQMKKLLLTFYMLALKSNDLTIIARKRT